MATMYEDHGWHGQLELGNGQYVGFAIDEEDGERVCTIWVMDEGEGTALSEPDCWEEEAELVLRGRADEFRRRPY